MFRNYINNKPDLGEDYVKNCIGHWRLKRYGASISKKLKQDGFTVAATYAGNDEAASSFTAETGIKTYKWDVASYEESKSGIEKVEAELGAIDVVVANAGILRDAPFHRMTPDQWNE